MPHETKVADRWRILFQTVTEDERLRVRSNWLRGAHPAGLLAEWLQLLHAHGAHPPARFLPNMFDTAARRPRLRVLVSPVRGERGHWLARRQ